MKFINSKQQIKQYNSSVTVDLSFESLESFLQDAENSIIAIIGEENADAIAASTDFVASLVKASVVNFALHDYADSGQMLVSDSGMHVSKSQTTLPASDKKIISFKRSCHEKAWKALEEAIYRMERDYTSWPIWYLSDERKLYLKSLINFYNTVIESSSISISVPLFQKLKPEIRKIEEDTIVQILGEGIYDALHTRLLNHQLDDLDRKLLTRIIKAVIPLAVAYTIPYLAIEVDSYGVYQTSQAALASQSDNIEVRASANTRAMQNTMNRLISNGEADLERLRKWMNAHGADFPGYGSNAIAPMASINQDPDIRDSGFYFF